jgi:hypothetical protein
LAHPINIKDLAKSTLLQDITDKTNLTTEAVMNIASELVKNAQSLKIVNEKTSSDKTATDDKNENQGSKSNNSKKKN